MPPGPGRGTSAVSEPSGEGANGAVSTWTQLAILSCRNRVLPILLDPQETPSNPDFYMNSPDFLKLDKKFEKIEIKCCPNRIYHRTRLHWELPFSTLALLFIYVEMRTKLNI